MDLKLPADTVEGMKEAVFKDHYKSLEEYLECFSYMTAVMRTPASLERIAYELGCDVSRTYFCNTWLTCP